MKMENSGSDYSDSSSDVTQSGVSLTNRKPIHMGLPPVSDGMSTELEHLLGHTTPDPGASLLGQVASCTGTSLPRQTVPSTGSSPPRQVALPTRTLELRQGSSPAFRTTVYSYPVINMTKAHRVAKLQFHKIRGRPTQSLGDLKREVCRMFDVLPDMVSIIEEAGKNEEVLLKTIIVILPQHELEECYTLIVETFEMMDQVHPQMLCVRLPVVWKVSDTKKLLLEDLKWKGLALCGNGHVLEDELVLREGNFANLDKIQAIQQSTHEIRVIYQPRSDVTSVYSLDVDMNSSVKQVKQHFETHFHDDLQNQKDTANAIIHFCFQDRLLEDGQCIGLVLRRNIKDEDLSLHFGSETSISVGLKYRTGRKTKHKLLIISKHISTACLRAEVSKHLGVDPKAVKLTFEDKLIDEHENLGAVYREKWENGCKIAAGIKKCKILQIKHPTEAEEVAFEMYMLEPVSVLKRKVAEKWHLNLLQISLCCRGMLMENTQPLQHYPIKNNMEISLCLFEHRIFLDIVIRQEKKRLCLIVDDRCVTTVDELLRFCAHHFKYPRQCSRGVFKDQCLNLKFTLAQEGIGSGDTVIIAYFDQSSLLQGGLMNIFIADETGHTIRRLGAVNSGLLLHAPKTAEVPQTEHSFNYLDNGPVPQAIYVCDESSGAISSMARQTPMSRSSVKWFNSRSDRPITKDILKHKPEFLKKAKIITQQKLSQQMEQLKLHTDIPEVQQVTAQFYLPVGNSDCEMGSTSQQLDLNEETGKTAVMTSTYDRENSLYTGVKTRANKSNTLRETVGSSEDAREQRGVCECVSREVESDCGPSSVKHDIGHHLKCIENYCRKIQDQNREKPEDVEVLVPDGLVPGSQMPHVPGPGMAESQQENYSQHISNRELIGEPARACIGNKTKVCLEHRSLHSCECNNEAAKELQQEETIPMTDCHNSETTNKHAEVKTVISKNTSFYLENNDLRSCDMETSGCESGHNRLLTYKPIVVTHTDHAAETDSSSIEHVTSRHGEDCQCTKCWAPYYQQCPYLQKLNQHKFHHRQPRTHTVSESALALQDIPLMNRREQLPLNRTFPTFEVARNFKPNADIETSGVSIVLLNYVAKHVGTKWKQLLRQLCVAETELSTVEYTYSISGLYELTIQALLMWKQEKGAAGSQEVLLKALEDIGLKSVAEKCTNNGYCTA